VACAAVKSNCDGDGSIEGEEIGIVQSSERKNKCVG
jgi:hypothetical protein